MKAICTFKNKKLPKNIIQKVYFNFNLGLLKKIWTKLNLKSRCF